jgi:cold shock CspA family protein
MHPPTFRPCNAGRSGINALALCGWFNRRLPGLGVNCVSGWMSLRCPVVVAARPSALVDDQGLKALSQALQLGDRHNGVDRERDVFVHISVLERSGLIGLVEDQQVVIDVGEGRKGPEAVKVCLL